MAKVQGRPTPTGADSVRSKVRGVDKRQHPQHNVTARRVTPVNFSPLGPTTRHVSKPK